MYLAVGILFSIVVSLTCTANRYSSFPVFYF